MSAFQHLTSSVLGMKMRSWESCWDGASAAIWCATQCVDLRIIYMEPYFWWKGMCAVWPWLTQLCQEMLMFTSEFQHLLFGDRLLLGQEKLFRQGLWYSESISISWKAGWSQVQDGAALYTKVPFFPAIHNLSDSDASSLTWLKFTLSCKATLLSLQLF